MIFLFSSSRTLSKKLLYSLFDLRRLLYPKVETSTLQFSICKTIMFVVVYFNGTGARPSLNIYLYSPNNTDVLYRSQNHRVPPGQTAMFLGQTGEYRVSVTKNAGDFIANVQVSFYWLQGCGDGVKDGPFQQCDNRNQTGCIWCQIALGYSCTQDANLLSNCTTVCGDGIRAGSQQCDNRNATGCINCVMSPGYRCIQDANLTSTCNNAEFKISLIASLLLLMIYIFS